MKKFRVNESPFLDENTRRATSKEDLAYIVGKISYKLETLAELIHADKIERAKEEVNDLLEQNKLYKK